MASIFLINDNKIVSRLLQLSSDKHGYLLEEKLEAEPSKDHYDIVLVDSDRYTPDLIEKLKDKTSFDKAGYIGLKKEDIPAEFDIRLDKPFLPSDFVAMIEATITQLRQETPSYSENEQNKPDDIEKGDKQISENVEKLLEQNDDNIDQIAGGEVEELDEIDELDTLDFDEEIPDKSILEADQPDQAALKEIDKTEDALKELDELDEELENADLSLDSAKVMSTGVAEQFLQEPEEGSNRQEELSANEQKTPQNTIKTTIAAAAMATGAALMTEKEQILQEIVPENENNQSSLDALEGIEDIEKESDYIAKEEKEIGEFDSLDEKEVQKALNPSNETDTTDEIIKEDIVTEATETIVETNDVQQWIQDAVSKAITPEMIKEALNDMKINITLDFTKKES